jgi:hypothetical protein
MSNKVVHSGSAPLPVSNVIVKKRIHVLARNGAPIIQPIASHLLADLDITADQ